MASTAKVVADDLTRLKKRLDKAIEANDHSAPEVVEALEALAGMKVTAKLLQQTRVGFAVVKLRKSETKEVAAAAKSLYKTWKTLATAKSPKVKKHKKHKHSKSDASSTKSGSSTLSNGSKSSGGGGGVGGAGGGAGAKAAESGLHKTRVQARTLFARLFTSKYDAAKSGGVAIDPEARATELETAIFTQYGKSNIKPAPEYWSRFRSLHYNLGQNADLLRDVAQCRLPDKQTVLLSPEEMLKADVREARAAASKEAFESRQMDWDQKNRAKVMAQMGLDESEGMFKCKVCKGRNTTYTQKQTRSADEPMTTFCLCEDCGYRWRFC